MSGEEEDPDDPTAVVDEVDHQGDTDTQVEINDVELLKG